MFLVIMFIWNLIMIFLSSNDLLQNVANWEIESPREIIIQIIFHVPMSSASRHSFKYSPSSLCYFSFAQASCLINLRLLSHKHNTEFEFVIDKIQISNLPLWKGIDYFKIYTNKCHYSHFRTLIFQFPICHHFKNRNSLIFRILSAAERKDTA